MRRGRIAAALTAALLGGIGMAAVALGEAEAKDTTFSRVPANIADAPVSIWHNVQRRDRGNAFRWRAAFDGGSVWVSAMHPGRYWSNAPYSSKSRVLGIFKKDGFQNFRRVESTTYAGSQWGYMAVADWKDQSCIVGVVLDNDSFDHDGPSGGTLLGYAIDCGSGAVGRFDEWRTWFRSFKRVPLGYNAALDR